MTSHTAPLDSMRTPADWNNASPSQPKYMPLRHLNLERTPKPTENSGRYTETPSTKMMADI